MLHSDQNKCRLPVSVSWKENNDKVLKNHMNNISSFEISASLFKPAPAKTRCILNFQNLISVRDAYQRKYRQQKDKLNEIASKSTINVKKPLAIL